MEDEILASGNDLKKSGGTLTQFYQIKKENKKWNTFGTFFSLFFIYPIPSNCTVLPLALSDRDYNKCILNKVSIMIIILLISTLITISLHHQYFHNTVN